MTTDADDLARTPLGADRVGLLEGLVSTRAIRRYTPEPIPPSVLRDILFAATRAPTGSNRQPFRFIVLTDGDLAAQVKELVGSSARRIWAAKRQADGYDRGSGGDDDSPKARTARAMAEHVEGLGSVAALILPCLVRYREPTPTEGGSIYPACQNLLLAARALGYGGVLTGWHAGVEVELRSLLEIPDNVLVAGTILLGRPKGHHGPVRRRPLDELVFERWGQAPAWAVDPPGTRHTSAGPPPAGTGSGPRRADRATPTS